MEALKVLGVVVLILLAFAFAYWYIEVYTVRKHWREATQEAALQMNLFPQNMPPTQTAGITIDSWKLDIFKRHITGAGYDWPVPIKLAEGVLLLRVKTTNLEALGAVVLAANTEAAKTGAPK